MWARASNAANIIRIYRECEGRIEKIRSPFFASSLCVLIRVFLHDDALQ